MDCTKTNKQAMSWLKGNVDEERLLHSLGCAQTAVELAQQFGVDEKRAYVAGLLHDCAKCLEKDKLIELAQEIEGLKEDERSNVKVIHAPVSAYIAKEEFGVEDEEILSSIRWHTLGKVNMSLFEKIIFLADKIEPNTRDLDFRDRAMLYLQEENPENGLNRAILLCYKETIKSLVVRNLKICQDTIEIYNSMINKADK